MNLSQREEEILKCIKKRWTIAEIANHFVLSISTIKSHQAAIFNKLGVHQRESLFDPPVMPDELEVL